MKKALIIIALFFITGTVANAQAPQSIPYQAVARNSSGSILASQAISLRFTIHDSIATGTTVYQETFAPTTNSLGLFSVNVGTGSVVSGTFNAINWGANHKYMQVELDPTGGTSYVDMGTQQMMSVPYAIYSNMAGNGNPAGTAGDILYNNGSNWFRLAAGANGQVLTMNSGLPVWGMPLLSIGEPYGGGIVAYILLPGDPGYSATVQHGLIAAPSDQSTPIQWYNNGSYYPTTGATGTAIGTGFNNTNLIIIIQGAGSYPASICRSLTLGGYTDWYLPSKDELNILYLNRNAIGGFSAGHPGNYWSSSEWDSEDTWYQEFDDSGQFIGDNGNVSFVRAVRAF